MATDGVRQRLHHRKDCIARLRSNCAAFQAVSKAAVVNNAGGAFVSIERQAHEHVDDYLNHG